MSIQSSINTAISAGVGGAVAKSVKDAAELEKTERQARISKEKKLEEERVKLEIAQREQELKEKANLEAKELAAHSLTPEGLRHGFEAEHGEGSAEGMSDEDIYQYYQGYSVDKAASANMMLTKNTLGKAQQKAVFEQRKRKYGGKR